MLVLLVLLSEEVSVASGESSICDRRFVLRQRDSSNGIEGAASEGSQPSSSDDKHERRYGALSRGRGFMGAAVVKDPAVVVFAGGIGSGGTVVDSNVDAFSLGAGVLARGADGDGATTAAVGGAGRGGVVVDRDVLS